ncbi:MULTISPECIES: cytochrome c biogenesis protein ResB [Cellulomonas]|uniref:ResB family protein n=1 Tax=Cellulomonas gilvus (strain ATCC 13127 / NRRL B-14078) TaxID=593907 RepID=F8A2P9_CELGA|nr:MULTISPECIES: cytochrome c biogenesis protein ResB [Cellulomonas]AEI13042.1 ResB family protein [Cellulomonas gilvus ATCC 13127]MCR6689200.1 cytochrome c biogenesis protein ResB [Cellulomonas sp.]
MSGYRPAGLEDSFAAPSADEQAPGSAAPPQLPSLGPVGWLRWAWRQLTSMRVALLLLMLLAVAAVPGTIYPQRAQDVAEVATYIADHPTSGPWLDRLGFFDVYSSVWFSAIYLMLFVSLVGCILPRTRVHLAAVRGRPPRTPRRLTRFPAQAAGSSSDTPEQVARAAAAAMRRGRYGLPFVRAYRVDVHDEGGGTWSAAGERGYLRETGNLVFHLALVGLLVSVAAGQMLHYRGQAIVVQGRGMANSVQAYDTFEKGSAFRPESLEPFTLTLDSFDAVFDPDSLEPRDFTAGVTVTDPDGTRVADTLKVNHPLERNGAKIYLQGNGYAPSVTVRDGTGDVAFAGAVPFLPQDEVYTSRGVVKVPDVAAGQDQIGLVGYLLPTAQEMAPGLWRSADPQPTDPLLVLSVWSGNLGLDTGVPQNVYELDEERMTQALEEDGTALTLYLRPGETVDLPDGLGSVTFDRLDRYVALDLRHDPALTAVLVFSLLAFAGLATSLFAPRRRLWVRAAPAADDAQDHGPGTGSTVVSAAGLARGDDVGLQPELDRVLAETLTPTRGSRTP